MLYVHLCESLNDERQFGQNKLIAYTVYTTAATTQSLCLKWKREVNKTKIYRAKNGDGREYAEKKEIGIDGKQ